MTDQITSQALLLQGWGQSRSLGRLLHVTVSSRLWGLQAEEGEGLEAGAVPAQVAAGGGVVGVACAVEDADDDVGDRGEQPGGVSGAQPGGVFAEGCVAPVVQAVVG